MLAKRLAAGSALGIAAFLMLVIDGRAAPYYPALFAVAMATGAFTALELSRLTPVDSRPSPWLVIVGVLAVLAANWVGPIAGLDPWRAVALTLTAAILAAFGYEMAVYDGSGDSGKRVATAAFAYIYLGLLPSFLLQIRWLDADPTRTALLLAATVVAAKGCDIGAYVVGRLVGRTPFAPTLSPKKTWEGFIGGICFAAGLAAIVEGVTPLFRHGLIEAALFGATVGTAGVLGDLAESMLKRDANAKDAATRIPGFGGVLDVFDSLIFAGPVAYAWLGR